MEEERPTRWLSVRPFLARRDSSIEERRRFAFDGLVSLAQCGSGHWRVLIPAFGAGVRGFGTDVECRGCWSYLKIGKELLGILAVSRVSISVFGSRVVDSIVNRLVNLLASLADQGCSKLWLVDDAVSVNASDERNDGVGTSKHLVASSASAVVMIVDGTLEGSYLSCQCTASLILVARPDSIQKLELWRCVIGCFLDPLR